MAEYQSIKEHVLQTLQEKFPELQNRFGVETIGIFGSVARGEDTESSDIDILYTFQEGRATLYHVLDLQEYLENLFGRSVDLVSAEYIDPIIELNVKKDAVLYGAAAV